MKINADEIYYVKLMVYTPLHRKLHSSDHGQLLLNLCFALLGLYMTFIMAIHSPPVPGLCAAVGALQQYFFLVTFMLMAAEAISLYTKLVVVLGSITDNFVQKSLIVSWGEPNMTCNIHESDVSWNMYACV